MKKLQTCCLIVCSFLFLCCTTTKTTGLTNYIDPYIGTSGHGHTFMGVVAPFGAVQVGPNNINKGWDWSSGYHYSDSITVGFAHLHLNGTGCSDTGDIILMPYTGEITTIVGTQDDPDNGYASRYSHDNEVVSASYYSLTLDDYDIKAELTASERVALHRYTFPTATGKHIIINLKDANGDDRPVETYLEQVDEYNVRGHRYSTGWSKDQRVFFSATFSEPVKLQLYDDNTPMEGSSLKSKMAKGVLTLDDNIKEVMVKVGLSPVSSDNATMNIEAEIPHWNFQKVVAQTEQKWEREMSRIKIETDNEVDKRIFYTSMYHAFIHPTLFNDVNSDYRGTDKKVYSAAPFTNYTVFSLWDTYRAAHPLYTIIQSERVPDFINSFLAIHRQQGILPVWHLYGSDTWEMIGIQSIPVIADAILKGVEGFDYDDAFEAMKNSMISDYKGLGFLKEGKYIPADKERESVAKGLEYAIADWGIAQVAKKLGKEEDYELFAERAKNYEEYWDSETQFFRGKKEDGSWTEPFNPFHSAHRSDDYCEGTGWQYIWLVPHDVEGLIKLFGGDQEFTQKLDDLFIVDGVEGEDASGDISGLIGQYAHGNEPGHHTIYLYAFAGEQWKTAEKARYILNNLYSDQADGLEGNEDCGQISSWYILSSLGFYPVNPSNGIYVFGSPHFDTATVELPNNKQLMIKTINNSDANKYIQSVTLNGANYTKSYIKHSDIMSGGEIVFTMGEKPNKKFGASESDRPSSLRY